MSYSDWFSFLEVRWGGDVLAAFFRREDMPTTVFATKP
jgi:hypothetical protein